MNLVEKFITWEKKVEAFDMAMGVLGIDNIAVPPSQGRAYRDEHTAILAGEVFKLRNDSEIYEVMEKLLEDNNLIEEGLRECGLEASLEEVGDFRRRVELYHEEGARRREIPIDKFVEYQKVLEKSKTAWLSAKADNDWKSYAPILKDVFEGCKELTAYEKNDLSIFERLLDHHEKGMTGKDYDIFFNQVKERLVPIIKTKENNKPINDLWTKEYSIEKQRLFSEELLEYIGFTSKWGKMSESEHPLTSWISSGDVRFTTHYRLHNPVDSILSTIHESGHAWYTHNVSEKYDGNIVSNSISSAMHESQSRFCENHLARSKVFWQVHLPRLKELFSDQLGDISLDDFYKVVNEAKPSLIRTQADELTYPLHIVIRYELEREVFEGRLDPMDLMEAWNCKYKEYLGIDVPDASSGVLQDMHWSYGYFGYFPTYALGSAYAAQFDYYMRKEIDPDKLMLENRYTDIVAWLKEHIQKYANRYPSGEIIKIATGEGFNPKYYLDYLEKKYK